MGGTRKKNRRRNPSGQYSNELGDDDCDLLYWKFNKFASHTHTLCRFIAQTFLWSFKYTRTNVDSWPDTIRQNNINQKICIYREIINYTPIDKEIALSVICLTFYLIFVWYLDRKSIILSELIINLHAFYSWQAALIELIWPPWQIRWHSEPGEVGGGNRKTAAGRLLALSQVDLFRFRRRKKSFLAFLLACR